jgi:hypothetical protein
MDRLKFCTWQHMSTKERLAFQAHSIAFKGKVIQFNIPCRQIDPKTFSETELAAMEQAHGFKIRRN